MAQNPENSQEFTDSPIVNLYIKQLAFATLQVNQLTVERESLMEQWRGMAAQLEANQDRVNQLEAELTRLRTQDSDSSGSEG